MTDRLAQEAAAVRQLAEYLSGEDLEISIHSETNWTEAIDAALHVYRIDLTLSAACKAEADNLAARAKRLAARAEQTKERIAEALETSGRKQAQRPTATLSSYVPTKRKVIVTDEEALPACYKITDIKIDRDKLSKDLNNGRTIEGACLGNAKPTLRILTK